MCLTSVYFYVIIVISPALKGDLDSARIVAQRALNPLDTHTHTHIQSCREGREHKHIC